MSRFRRLINRLRGRHNLHEEFASQALREKFRKQGVEIGLYSYGCFDLQRVPAGVSIGRYCSFAPTAQIFLRNHGIDFLGLSAYFYNQHLGVVESSTIPSATLAISDDVWFGHNCIILPQVGVIGRGAVIAAGAVVTRPVLPYTVVAGNPARVVRMRFDEETIAAVEATRWWLLDTDELRKMIQEKPEMAFNPRAYFTTWTT